MSGKARKPGTPPDEDHALWDRVKQSIKPLKKSRAAGPIEAPPAKSGGAPRKSETTIRRTAQIPPEKKSAPKPPPALAQFDRRTRQRIARGRVEIDARLDLHGLTLERARRRLLNFLLDAQENGEGLVLVITGKGRGAREPGEQTGALRREVPMWLSQPDMRLLVIGFEEASTSHGGSGALYVRVRRAR